MSYTPRRVGGQYYLEIHPKKLAAMANKHVPAGDMVKYNGTVVKMLDSFEVLGSEISINGNEMPAYTERVVRCNRSFYKWQAILLCKDTDIHLRIAFWCKTIALSLIWGLETTRSAQKPQKLLQQTQRDHVVRMMGLKRRVDQHGNYETWLEYHVRRYRAAKIAINSCGSDIVSMLKARRLSFIGHVARFGQGDRD